MLKLSRLGRSISLHAQTPVGLKSINKMAGNKPDEKEVLITILTYRLCRERSPTISTEKDPTVFVKSVNLHATLQRDYSMLRLMIDS